MTAAKEGGNERERRTAACIWIPWKKSKLWMRIFFCILLLSRPRKRFPDPLNSVCCKLGVSRWLYKRETVVTPGGRGSRGPLIQWMANVLPTRARSAAECEARRRRRRSSRTCLSHSSPVNKTRKRGFYWPCSFPREEQRRTDVACNQIPKLTLAAAAWSLYDEDVSMFNKPVSMHEQS